MRRRLYQITIIVVSLFVINGLSRNLVELWQQKMRLKRAADEVVQLKLKEEELKKQLEYYQSDEYVEKIARDKLLLAKPGETILLLPQPNGNNPINQFPISTNNPMDTETNQVNLSNWQKWAKLFGF